ncbi:MAG: peptidase S41, partial [Bacteroidota bacterium]
SDATSSPDGRYIAFVRGGCRISREAYRGPANRDIWLYDTQNDTYTQITKDEGQDYAPTWTLDNQLFFLSAREGRYNLFRIDPLVSATLSQVTDFSDWGIRNYSISADGKSMAIERGTGLELSQDGGTSFQKLNIQVGGDFKFYPTEEKSLSGELREFALSPNEKYLAIGTRGELFIKPNDKDKKRSKNVTEHPYREEDAAWLNDSTLLFTSDRTAAEFPSLLLCQSAPKGNLYQSFARETTTILDLPNGVTDFKLSPDRTKIAIIEGRGGLLVYDIDSLGQLSSKTVLLDGWDYPGGLSWSPDGKWLAYNLSDLDFNEEIYIHASDNSQAPVNVSMHPRGDYSPTWSPDGSKLGFLSIRNNGNADAWFVWLRQEDYERTQRDWEEADDWSNEEEKDTSGTVVIDFANIHERLVQVSSLPGNEGDLIIGAEGEYFYFTTNNGSRAGSEGDSDLMKIKWDGKEMEALLEDVEVYDLALSNDGKTLYMLQNGKVASTPLDKGKAETQAFTAKMEIEHQQER